MSHAYDVANGICLSAVLDRYEASERDLALRNMQAVYGLVGQSLPILWLLIAATLGLRQGLPGLSLLHPARADGSPVLDAGQGEFLSHVSHPHIRR